MQVVYSPAHQAHAPMTEIEQGRALGQYELPERAEEILRMLALHADRHPARPPAAHGLGPIDAVHDPGLARFLETAWAKVREEPALSDLPEVFPDTFVHQALRAGMGAPPRPEGASAQLGYWCFETMTPIVEGTYRAARAAVDVALTAADIVLGGEPAAYGLCRPPGHHAPRAAYGGYCYFNNAAIVAQHLAGATGTKITVLDVDYHHGNGTQQIFYERDDVQYVSLHADPNRAYPYFTGYAEEEGAGRGAGATLNLPMAPGTDDDAYLAALAEAATAVERFRPEIVVVSLGVDTFAGDPIADFAVTTDGLRRCGALVGALRRPAVILQEGGYAIGEIGRNVLAWLDGFEDGARR